MYSESSEVVDILLHVTSYLRPGLIMPTTSDDLLFATAGGFGGENSYRQVLFRLL